MPWEFFETDDLVEDIGFFCVIALLLYGNPIKKQIFKDLICFIYILYIVLETASYMAISSNFSSSYMYLLLESNKQELSEFMFSYISLPIVLFIICSSLCYFIIRKKTYKTPTKFKSIVSLLGVLAIVVLLKFTGFIESNAYHNIVRGTYGYIDLQNSVMFNSNIKTEDLSIKADNEVLVFVLGESTVRGHMQLYGYHRENTPLLEAMKDSLFVYENVISTDVFTLKSAPNILTSLNADYKSAEDISIVDVFNKAGYNTFWLSNQRPISYHDNAISKIASNSDTFKFYNHLVDQHTNILDEVLLEDYNNILNKPGKKVIFIRLIGTHFDYHKRYPKSFAKFTSKETERSKENTIINQYDNAVLYNDYIVHSIIKDLEKQNEKSALIYLSDHGENLYDEGTNFFGRNEEVLTKSMFEIPFLLWTSNRFEFPNDFEYKSKRKFMADHTFESVGHLFGVMHSSMDRTNSIFSDSFKTRQRKVLNSFDFDSNFLEKHE